MRQERFTTARFPLCDKPHLKSFRIDGRQASEGGISAAEPCGLPDEKSMRGSASKKYD
jgi:hypothetical protein